MYPLRTIDNKGLVQRSHTACVIQERVVHRPQVVPAEPIVSTARAASPVNNSTLPVLTYLQAAHHELLRCIEVMERVTSAHAPDVQQLTAARLKISQASFARRALSQKIGELLRPRASLAEAAVLRKLTELDRRWFSESSAHVSRWTVRTILADWAGYQTASRNVRAHIMDTIKTERSILYPMLQAHN
jgi:hypothetical protein